MVVPTASSVLTDGFAVYQRVLRQASDVFTTLITLYQSDIRTPRDWADITVSEATTQRAGLQQRLATTHLTEADTATLVGTLGHYIDTHWADYERVLPPDPVKHQQVEQLHAQLEALIREIAPLNNALRQQARE